MLHDKLHKLDLTLVLLGLGVLVYTGFSFPGVLLVMGIAGLLKGLIGKDDVMSLITPIILVVLGILMITRLADAFIPSDTIKAGLIIVVGLAHYFFVPDPK